MSYANNVNAEAGPSRAAKRPRIAREPSLPRAGVTPPRTRARTATYASHNDVFDASAVLAPSHTDYQQQRVAEWVQQRHPHVDAPFLSPKPSPAKSATAVSALQADQSYAHLRTPSRRVRAREHGTSDRGEAEGDPSVLFSDRTPRSQSGTPKSRGDEMIDALVAAYGPKPDLVRPAGYGMVQEVWDHEVTDILGEGELGGHEVLMPVAQEDQDAEADDLDADAEGEADDDSFLPVDAFWQGEPAAPTEPLPHRSTEDLDTPLPIADVPIEPTTTAPLGESSQLRIDGQQLHARASDYLPRPYAPAGATQPSQEPLTGKDDSDTLVYQSGEVFTALADRTRSPTPPPILPMMVIERLSQEAESRAVEQAGDSVDNNSAGRTEGGPEAEEMQDDYDCEEDYEEDDEEFDEDDLPPCMRDGKFCFHPHDGSYKPPRRPGMSSDPEDDDEEVVAGPSRPRQASASRARSASKTQRDLVVQDDEEEDDTPLAESYHSGDSDLYEMEYRPILERTEVKRDIREFVESLKTLRKEQQYQVVDRLGEGTFSSVYLAKDVYHNRYSNRYWSGKASIRRPDLIQKKRYDKPVALKKVLATSSPSRIENELSILEALRGCRNVSVLITAFREDDQVIIVLPYHQSDDFRYFYRLMDAEHMRSYMRNLMEGLADIHSRGIIHRDVKPANFLYDYAAQTGVLVDFGLAERYAPPRKVYCQHQPAGLEHIHGKRTKTNDTPIVEQAVYEARKKSRGLPEKVGIPKDDKRPPMRANRAGTRGFRAPEVLFKCPDQSFAIDMWSTGIMLLSILTHKFPIFNSNDDVEALMEIAGIYGRPHMEKCAMLHNRTMTSNVPQLDSAPNGLTSVILRLNPHIYTPPYAHPTPAQAAAHIEAMDAAMELCTCLLRLDCTRRFTARQALTHRFLATGTEGPDAEQRVHPMLGKCGMMHYVEGGPADDMGTDEMGEGHARHRATFGEERVDMPFGTGIPPTREDLCPEHLHYQQRTFRNPLTTCAPLWDPESERGMTEEDEGSEDEEYGTDTIDFSPTQQDSNTGETEGDETLVEQNQDPGAKYFDMQMNGDTADVAVDLHDGNTKIDGKGPWTAYEGADRALKDVNVNTPRRERMAPRQRAVA